jgi:hypothetical protein
MVRDASNYYTKFPKGDHAPGDIWANLTCFGALGTEPVRGVILTPACDLTNRKVESLTYLPVISVGQYFSTTAFLPTVYRRIAGLCSSANISWRAWDGYKYELPIPSELDVFSEKVAAIKDAAKREALLGGIEVFKAICSKDLVGVSRAVMTKFLGAKESTDLLEKIVKNSHSSDLHFLPADGFNAPYSAIPQHSVALFRYPQSVPLVLLDAANETPAASWEAVMRAKMERFPVAAMLSGARPIKLAEMEPRFFADLLTRYISLMIRLGAPSFDKASVERLLLEME